MPDSIFAVHVKGVAVAENQSRKCAKKIAQEISLSYLIKLSNRK